MSDRVTQRMRLRSHAHIRRLIEDREQRLRLRSTTATVPKNCKYLAHSAFLLCAVNPCGTCTECSYYEPK